MTSQGPIALDTPLEGVQFTRSMYSQTVTIEVPRSTTTKTLTVEALSDGTFGLRGANEFDGR